MFETWFAEIFYFKLYILFIVLIQIFYCKVFHCVKFQRYIEMGILFFMVSEVVCLSFKRKPLKILFERQIADGFNFFRFLKAYTEMV